MKLAVQGDKAQRISDGVALVITVGLVTVLTAGAPLRWQRAAAPAANQTQTVQLTLAEPASETTTPPPAPPPPRRRELPKPQAAVPLPAPADPLAIPSESMPEQAPVVAASTAAPAEAAPAAANADLEAEYAAALRAEVERRAHQASTQARERRAVGEAQVRFVVSRAGSPSSVSVMRSSGSQVLDRVAVEVVASGHYAPMPPVIFRDESAHLFAVTIEFGSGNLARSMR